jgi:uncharacterized protein YbjQ (UPF0145 family)
MRILLVLLACGAAFGFGGAQARDTELRMPISELMNDPETRAKLPNDVTFYFSGQPTPGVARTFGEYVSNRKTNAANKSDAHACRWAGLAALIHLRERAKQLGGNAVINVVSYYKKQTQASPTDYICHAGNIVAGVALKGTIVSTR